MIVAAEVNYLKTEEMSRFYNKNFELLEPYEGKLSRTVLRGESGSNTADLPDAVEMALSMFSIKIDIDTERDMIKIFISFQKYQIERED